MPNFGLSKPWIARLNAETEKYSDAVKCGKAISTSVTPVYNSASLFADNQETEKVDEFKNATVSLGVDTIPTKIAEMVFGHKIADDGSQTDNAEDYGDYVGYGFITAEMSSGKKKYRACVLYKVKFTEGEESYETKGDNITFKTPTMSGTAYQLENGDWRKKSPSFDTEKEADAWIQEILGSNDSSDDDEL